MSDEFQVHPALNLYTNESTPKNTKIMISRTLKHILPQKPTPSNMFFSTHPNTNNKDTLILSRLKHKDWLTPKEATTLLTSLTHPSSTLHFFHLYTSRKDFHPTQQLSTTLITKLAQSKHLPPLLSLHQTLTTKLHLFSDTLFFTLIKAYAHSFNRLDLALQTLRDMPSFGLTPSHRTFNLVLNVLVNSRLYNAARELFLDAPRLGVALDACSLNILIKGLCSLGDIDGAVRMVEEFPAMGCVANARTYATVMKGLCEVGRVGEAWGLLERMEREWVEVDAAVFNVLIGGLRKEGRVGEGLRMLEGMVGRGVRPNGGSYNEVVCGLVEEGRVGEAKEIVGLMEREGFVPSFEAYKGLVKGFCEKEMVGEVEWVVRDLVRKGFVPRMGMWRRIVMCVVQREGNSRWVDVFVDRILQDL